MPIRFENQPIGAGGLAAYATGQGRARERALERSLNIYRDEQIRQARREEQLRQQQWADQRQARQEAFQYSRDVSQFRQESMLRDQAAEWASQAAKQKSTADLASEQYELAKPQFDAMIKDMGGSAINKSDSPEVEAFKNRIATYQQYEQKASENVAAGEGKLTPQQFHSIAASEMGKILRDFDPDKHVTPMSQRPNAEYEDKNTGWVMRNTEEGPVRVKPIDENEELKKTLIPFTPVAGGQTYFVQPRYDRNGNRIPGYETIDFGGGGSQDRESKAYDAKFNDIVKQLTPQGGFLNKGQLVQARKDAADILEAERLAKQGSGSVAAAPGQQPAATGTPPAKVEVGADGKTVKAPLRPMPPSNMYPPQNNPWKHQQVASEIGPDRVARPVQLIPVASTTTDGLPPGSRWLDENTVLLPDGRTIRRKGQ